MADIEQKKARVWSERSIRSFLAADKEQLSAIRESWETTHGYVYRTDTGKLITLCDLPRRLAEEWRCETDPARNFANARLIVHAKKSLARNVQIIEQLISDRDSERNARQILRSALEAAKLDIEQRSAPRGELYNTICAALEADAVETPLVGVS